jgi:hypothetical protein
LTLPARKSLLHDPEDGVLERIPVPVQRAGKSLLPLLIIFFR